MKVGGDWKVKSGCDLELPLPFAAACFFFFSLGGMFFPDGFRSAYAIVKS